ncbi:MAG: NADPH-dependent FMN reductase, partial [Parcubacteria group bacterium GW2011_GWC1_44_10]
MGAPMVKNQISILGINGSPRKSGGTVNMLKEVLGEAQKSGAHTKLINLADYKMRPYHGDYDRKPDAETMKIFKEMSRFEGYVFATPVHWLASSSLMKIFIDNLTYLESQNFKLEGKIFGVVAHCWEDGGFQAAAQVASILDHMGLISPPYSIMLRNKNIKRSADTKWMWTDTKLLGKNVVLLCDIVRRNKPNWG